MTTPSAFPGGGGAVRERCKLVVNHYERHYDLTNAIKAAPIASNRVAADVTGTHAVDTASRSRDTARETERETEN